MPLDRRPRSGRHRCTRRPCRPREISVPGTSGLRSSQIGIQTTTTHYAAPPLKRRHIALVPLRLLFVRYALELVLVLCGLCVTWPLWATVRPPIQDLPQHVAAVRVLSSFSDPSYRFQEYFELTLGKTQYLTVYLAALPIAKLLGPVVATKAVLSLTLIATPFALSRLLRALKFDPWLACLGLPLLFNVHVAYGFLNFVAGIPLLFVGLALAVEQRERTGLVGQVLLGLTLLVCFLTHVVPFALLGMALILLTPLSRRALSRQALLMLPSALAASVWLLASPAGKVVASLGQAVRETPHQATHLPFGAALRMLPDWVLHLTTAESEPRLVVIWLLLTLALLALSLALPRGGAHQHSDEHEPTAGRVVVMMLVPLSMLAYFLLPNGYGFIWPISQRFPVLALFLSITLLGRAPRWAIGPAAVLCIGLSVQAGRDHTELFRRAGDTGFRGFDEVIGRIPLGSRVATLVFERQLEGLQLSPLMHSAGWVQAERGGLVMFTFAEFPSSPFTYRADRRPPAVAPRWEWGPDRVVPDRDLGWYDYCLVQGWSGSLEASRRFTEIARRGRWSLWRHDRTLDSRATPTAK